MLMQPFIRRTMKFIKPSVGAIRDKKTAESAVGFEWRDHGTQQVVCVGPVCWSPMGNSVLGEPDGDIAALSQGVVFVFGIGLTFNETSPFHGAQPDRS
jgi:hypothetical protein